MSKWEWRQFNQLQTAEDLEDYLAGREYRHGGFFHYTSLGVINSILSKNEFWLSNVQEFNDSYDARQFSNPETCFSLCFSTGRNENLPLWYLYSGLDGKGARIQLTEGAIRKLIAESSYDLYTIENNQGGGISLGKHIATLEDSKTMVREFRDVLYCRENPEKDIYDLKYNTMTNYQIPMAEFEAYREKHNGFQKGLIWYYEKETRLLVRLIGDMKRKVEKEKDKKYVVVLRFSDAVLRQFKVMFAPNVGKEERDEILKTYPGIYEFLMSSLAVSLSAYAGSINMRLCDRCEKNRQITAGNGK